MFSENTVKLRETIETAGFRYLRDGYLCVDEQRLHVSNSCHLDIVGYGESGYLLESVGKIAGTYAEMLGEKVKGQVFGIVRVDITRDRIYLLFQLCQVGFVGIYVAVLVEK